MTIVDKFREQQKAERQLHLRRAVFAELESVFETMSYLAQVGNMPANEAMDLVTFAFDCFIAEVAINDDLSKEDFLKEMGEAYDEAKKEEDEEPETDP